jgi:hypothetical protein
VGHCKETLNLPTNIRLDQTKVEQTNTLAYFLPITVTKGWEPTHRVGHCKGTLNLLANIRLEVKNLSGQTL